jgi:hypothetical protein
MMFCDHAIKGRGPMKSLWRILYYPIMSLFVLKTCESLVLIGAGGVVPRRKGLKDGKAETSGMTLVLGSMARRPDTTQIQHDS